MNTKKSLAISRWLFVILMLGFLFFPQFSSAVAGQYGACNEGDIPSNGECCDSGHPYYCGPPFNSCCRESGCSTCPDRQNPETVDICYEGLVPCGKKIFIEGIVDPGGFCTGGNLSSQELPCQLCHFFILLDAVLDFVINLAFIVAVLLVVFAGLLFIVGEVLAGSVSPGLINKAKSILQSVLIGLVILFAAWIVVNTIFMFLGVADWTKSFTGPSNWFIINCPIELPEGFN